MSPSGSTGLCHLSYIAHQLGYYMLGYGFWQHCFHDMLSSDAPSMSPSGSTELRHLSHFAHHRGYYMLGFGFWQHCFHDMLSLGVNERITGREGVWRDTDWVNEM
jgi:hypothetical protein